VGVEAVKVLHVEAVRRAGAEAESDLRAAGHEVVGCESFDPTAPCRGLEPVGGCPIDDGDVDVALVSRSGSDLTMSERGALCAARHRIPVVVDSSTGTAVSFGPGTFIAGDDVVKACEQAAHSGAAHEAAIRRELVGRGVLDAHRIDGPDADVAFEVTREPRRLHLTVFTSAQDGAMALTKAAVEALRRFDPYVAVIDVSHRPFVASLGGADE
jgi:hypothetical protein